LNCFIRKKKITGEFKEKRYQSWTMSEFVFFLTQNAKGDLKESKHLTVVDQVKRRKKQRRKPLTLGDQEVTRRGFEWCC
jgi:hypothetical protein